jgi:hypothetical protein
MAIPGSAKTHARTIRDFIDAPSFEPNEAQAHTGVQIIGYEEQIKCGEQWSLR